MIYSETVFSERVKASLAKNVYLHARDEVQVGHEEGLGVVPECPASVESSSFSRIMAQRSSSRVKISEGTERRRI